jgi:tetraacyldisaccharide 4'-kinase
LTPLGWAYAGAAAVRNGLYTLGIAPSRALGRPAVSVGNLTAGGTGKTPLTFWILEWARRKGVELALLTRGYGGRGGANDEVEMARGRFPGLAVGVGGDRAESAAGLLTERPSIRGFVLDDAFQHRRARRELDIVLVDATDPFGGGACLPRGLLREPRSGVKRASLVILTRASQAQQNERDRIWGELRSRGYAGPVVEADHAPARLEPLDRRGDPRPLASLRGTPVSLLSAIANPGSFERTMTGLGATVARHLTFPDHHELAPAELPDLRGVGGGIWCVTEKDAVKLRRLGVVDGWFLRLELSIRTGEHELRSRLDALFEK